MSVVLDGTPLDSNHRHRGLGRYVQGIIGGFSALKERGELDVELKVLRLARRPDDSAPTGFEELPYARLLNTHAKDMFLENRLRLDRALPHDAAVFHGTAMEGYASRARLVATCHDLIPLVLGGSYLPVTALGERLFWNRYVKLLRDDAARVVAISEHVKQTLSGDYGVAAEKIDVVHHGLAPFWSEPADLSSEAVIHRDLPPGPYVLFVGGFDSRKRFDNALVAIRSVPEKIRPRLVVVGQRGVADKKRHDRLSWWHKAEATFLEKVSDQELRSLYRNALCLMFPSVEEGWGFPIVEAMAAGTPVICAGFGSMAEAAGGAAMTVNVESVEDLTHGVRTLISNEAARRSLSERGLERVKRLSWTENARALQGVYLRTAGGDL